MLNNRSLDDKTYEDLMREAIMQIPMYSSEWTNFNPSDPGMTILENLTAFEILQQNRIDQITPEIRRKLLKLVGFEEEKGRCARLLLSAEHVRTPMLLPSGQKFYLGDVCFETNRPIEISDLRLTGIYWTRNGEWHDCSYLADREVKVPALLFGGHPQPGDSVSFLADGLPGPGEEVIFSVSVADSHNRNPFLEKGNNTFAGLKWECFTENGFQEMKGKDGTGCFLVNGEIRLRLPESPAIPCNDVPGGGYVIRAVLTKASYDVCPRLTSVDGFLFEAWQKDTRAACHTFNRVSNASIKSELLKDGYESVFCKEEKGSSYHRYFQAPSLEAEGRFYERSQSPDGTVSYHFDKRRFRFGPEKLKNSIKIVIYSEEIMRQYYLGTVLGYDNQIIDLPVDHVVADSFCIIARRTDPAGEYLYDFVRPNRHEEDDLTYYLFENDGRILIEDAGSFIGAELYMAAVSITRGEAGNIRAGSRLTGVGLERGITFYNPQPGTGGAFRETIEDVKKRFLLDLKKSYTAVTADDYESLVKSVPGLCIRKVKAVMDETRNLVRIAVMPDTEEEFPGLSDDYRKAIETYLEDKRLLTTKIEITSPQYVPVDVHGVIYVRQQYENSLQEITQTIRTYLDHIHSERNFGDVLKFDQLFHEIEALNCVEFIYELSLHPQRAGLAKMADSDVIPAENCLCYAGEIILETGTYRK